MVVRHDAHVYACVCVYILACINCRCACVLCVADGLLFPVQFRPIPSRYVSGRKPASECGWYTRATPSGRPPRQRSMQPPRLSPWRFRTPTPTPPVMLMMAARGTKRKRKLCGQRSRSPEREVYFVFIVKYVRVVRLQKQFGVPPIYYYNRSSPARLFFVFLHTPETLEWHEIDGT